MINSNRILSTYYEDTNIDNMDNHIDIKTINLLSLVDIKFDDEFIYDGNGLRWGSHDICKIDDQNIGIINKIQFTNCEFNRIPKIVSNDIYSIEFNNCRFKHSSGNLIKDLFSDNTDSSKSVKFNYCHFDNFIISNEDIKYNLGVKICKFNLYGGVIENLTIQNIELSSKLYFNRQQSAENEQKTQIKNLKIYDSVFKENFKLHHCNIQNILIKNTDFEKQADFYKSSFHNGISEYNDKSIYFKALNFGGLTIFGHCEFTRKVIFSSVTFGDFVHFKKAHFENGLDLDYTNIQKEMNFFDVTGLDSSESQENTSQETYRIVKYNFQKIGNQIEANKYHALELNVHRQDTWHKIKEETWYKIQDLFFLNRGEVYFEKKTGTLLLDIIPSLIHKVSSNYGQSWLLPLIWILAVGVISNCLISGCSWDNISNFTEILKHVSIINLDDTLKDNPKIFLFNKISLGYLYYQFINATRKNIKK